MLHKQTFSAVKKKKRKKTWKIISFDKVFSTERLTTDAHQVSQRAFPLSCAVLTTHTLKPPEDAGNLCSTSPPPPLLPPPSLSRSEMSGLDVGYHSAPVSGTAPNCARDLSSAFWSFLSVSTPLCFPGGGNQPRTILWLKQGQQGEPMQRKSCRNIQRKTQHLTLMWKLLN